MILSVFINDLNIFMPLIRSSYVKVLVHEIDIRNEII